MFDKKYNCGTARRMNLILKQTQKYGGLAQVVEASNLNCRSQTLIGCQGQ